MSKRTIMCRMLVATIAVALLPAMASAQTDSTATSPKKEKLSEKMSRLLKRARTSMENAGHQLGDAIGFDDRIDSGSADSILIEGTYYMPLYDTSLYRGSDAMIYTDESRKLFAERYPEVEMLTVCLPQQEWITETVRMGNVVVGYRQTILHQEHVYSVLRHVFVMCCDVLVVVATVHQYAVDILLEEDDTRNVGQVLGGPHLAIARCRRILRTII